MRTTADVFSVSLLAYVIHTVAGIAFSSEEGSREVAEELPPIKEYISGGVICSRYSQPWHVGLFEGSTLTCSGALVHPQWVLTVAHCWQPSYTVKLGLVRLSRPYEPEVQIIEANYSVKHPNYMSQFTGNDAMLIKLSRPAVQTDSVRTIPVTTRCPRARTMCLVSGWGQLLDGRFPDDRQCVPVRVQPRKNCREMYSGFIDQTMFCAGGEGIQDSCMGDSGGPLSCRGVLQGLVSWGPSECRRVRIPGVYTKLCKLRDWIRETIKRN